MTDTDASTTGPRTGGQGARSPYLDALRAVALTRVVIYHAVSVEWVTLFTAMPLMFFVAGSLYAASLERRPARSVIRDRYRRILFPYWLYIAVMIGLWATLGLLGQITAANWVGIVMPVLSLNGPTGPGAGTDVELTWIALWYLQFHLILSLIGPWLRRAQQRRPRLTWGVLVGSFTLGIVAGAGVVVVIFYVSCWVLGYSQHDGDLERVLRRWWLRLCAVLGPAGAVLYLAFAGSVDWSPMALRLAGIGAAMLGVFWLVAAMGLRPRLEPLLRSDRALGVLNWYSRRSLSIYMWHLVAIYAVISLSFPGVGTWWGRLAWTAVLTVATMPFVGWAEDLAAKRSPQLWPHRTRART